MPATIAIITGLNERANGKCFMRQLIEWMKKQNIQQNRQQESSTGSLKKIQEKTACYSDCVASKRFA